MDRFISATTGKPHNYAAPRSPGGSKKEEESGSLKIKAIRAAVRREGPSVRARLETGLHIGGLSFNLTSDYFTKLCMSVLPACMVYACVSCACLVSRGRKIQMFVNLHVDAGNGT